TAIYTFRMIFIVFHGEAKIKAHKVKGITHTVPLAILAILATFVGAMIHQPLEGVFPAKPMEAEDGKLFIEAISGGFAIAV
ncbi:NADH-quinone oxidoreductase subunit L, partial [Klebsiella quasipneumoniae]|nr:NADH-quinone oxidoreductase subunit L [Klebsiella quasipneumoniae]